MMLPKLNELEIEYNEMKNNFQWFLKISGKFFDSMYGNIYENDDE